MGSCLWKKFQTNGSNRIGSRWYLDRDGFLGERDWRFYRLRRSAVNSVSALRLGEHGDETERNFVWRYRKSLPNVPSPLLYKNILYLMKEGGIT